MYRFFSIIICLFPIFLSIFCIWIGKKYFQLETKDLANFLTAGLSGFVVFTGIALKRWYDQRTISQAIKADLKCYSKYLSHTIRSLSDPQPGKDGVVNSRVYTNTRVFEALIDQIGLLGTKVAPLIIEIYDQIDVFVPAHCLHAGIKKHNEDQLYVEEEAIEHLKKGAIKLKELVDAVILKI